MSETSNETKPVTKPRRKRKPRTVRKAAAQPNPGASEYAGMTVANCATACNAEACVISGKPYCAHPRKGGLQGADAGDATKINRLNDAKKLLAQADADKRFE